MMKGIYATAFGFGAFFAMNCGSGDSTSDYPTSSPSGSQASQSQNATEDTGTTVVKVNGHTFDPPEVRIKVGTTVKWQWVGGSHNVVSGSSCSPDGTFTSGASTVGPGSTFEQKFETAGSFPYYCDPHCSLGMTGKVIVE